MIAFAAGAGRFGSDELEWLHGLEIVAVAVVALAVWSMARSLTPDVPRLAIALAAAAVALAWENVAAQVVVIAAAALIGLLFLDRSVDADDGTRLPLGEPARGSRLPRLLRCPAGRPPLLARATGNQGLDVFDSFYRAGALVFGGGHVVLPLLQTEVVEPGWVTNQEFVAGYGATQAVPGPLFTFAAYLGYVMGPSRTGLPARCSLSSPIFLPGILLVLGVLPFWDSLRFRPGAPRRAPRGERSGRRAPACRPLRPRLGERDRRARRRGPRSRGVRAPDAAAGSTLGRRPRNRSGGRRARRLGLTAERFSVRKLESPFASERAIRWRNAGLERSLASVALRMLPVSMKTFGTSERFSPPRSERTSSPAPPR